MAEASLLGPWQAPAFPGLSPTPGGPPRRGQQAGRPHTLRHAFITAALDAGVPLRDVQIAARHADPRTSQVALARCRAGAPSEPDKRAFPASRLRQAQWRCG